MEAFLALVLLAAVGGVIWFVVAVWRGADAQTRAAEAKVRGATASQPTPARVMVGANGLVKPERVAENRRPPTLDMDAANVADLRGLPSARYRIKGSSFVVSDSNRERFGGSEYHLVREPKNRHDACAVAIYGQGHKVGYVSASKAAALAPLLDQLPEDVFLVGGNGVISNSIRLWVDLPTLSEFRKYVKARTS